MIWTGIDFLLPEKAGRYLVANKLRKLVAEARYLPQKKIWKFPSAQMGFVVTHWTNLPEAPK